ncbi:LacI family DNA-binding transcriptional regulator [Paraglaciecola sp. Hal342]
MATIKDVAKLAGVSPATVSRCLVRLWSSALKQKRE